MHEKIQILILRTLAEKALGREDAAVGVMLQALALAEPGGFIRIFVGEGAPMAQLLLEAASHGIMSDYIGKLLAAFEAEKRPVLAASPGKSEDNPDLTPAILAGHRNGELQIEPLSQRELEVLRLIAQGLSNREIGERLFLALDTIKGYNRKIFDKLQVQSRTEAVARAHELGLL